MRLLYPQSQLSPALPRGHQGTQRSEAPGAFTTSRAEKGLGALSVFTRSAAFNDSSAFHTPGQAGRGTSLNFLKVRPNHAGGDYARQVLTWEE